MDSPEVKQQKEVQMRELSASILKDSMSKQKIDLDKKMFPIGEVPSDLNSKKGKDKKPKKDDKSKNKEKDQESDEGEFKSRYEHPDSYSD